MCHFQTNKLQSAPIAQTSSPSPSQIHEPTVSNAELARSNITSPSPSFRDVCMSVSRRKMSLAVLAPGTMRKRVVFSALTRDARETRQHSSRSRFAVLMSP